MIELARHIEILLLDNDCVIVPGFGGFMTHHNESCYSEEEQLFLPPSRTLGFNPQLQVNDSLLAQSYVEAYDISYPEAIQRIEADVCEIRRILDNNGSFELINIGIISVNNDGNYVFEPCSSGVLTPSLYALTSFTMKPLEKLSSYVAPQPEEDQVSLSLGFSHQKQENTDSSKSEKDEQLQAGNEADSEVNSLEETIIEEDALEENETADNKVITISISSIRNLAVAVLLILVVVVTTLHFNANYLNGSQQASIDTSLLQKFMPHMKTTPVDKVSKRIKTSANNSKVASKNTNSTVESKNSSLEDTDTHSQESWVIVLASRVSGKNADLYIDQLYKDGIQSARKIRKGHKIVCGSFGSKDEAQSYIKVLKEKSTHCEDCWVTKIEE